MSRPSTLLHQRLQIEQRAILILRNLAGNVGDRERALEAIVSLGGTRTTHVALARLVGAALAMGYKLLPLYASHVSSDELALLRQLARVRGSADSSTLQADIAMRDALVKAARAFDDLGLCFPPVIKGEGSAPDEGG